MGKDKHKQKQKRKAEHGKASRATADRHPVEKADAHAAAAVAPLRDTNLVRITSALSGIADQPPLIALSAGVVGLGLVTRDRRLARAGLRMLAAHALATAVKSVIKNNVDRSRPAKLIEDGDYALERGRSHDKDLRSFPSGHTAGGVAVVRALAREYPGSAIPGGVAMSGVAAALIPKQAHYPSDIVAGAAIGWASEAVTAYVWDKAEVYLPKALSTR